MRRIVVLCVITGLVLGLGLAPAAAKGRCRSVSDGSRECNRGLVLSRVCHREGKRCSRSDDTCETLWVEVDCESSDGDPGTTTVGMGCFCGGGSPPVVRADPISVDEFLKLLETLESRDVDAETCEAPPELPEN